MIYKTTQGYEIHYEGGRLADVVVDGRAVETVQVRGYDWETGEFTEPYPSGADIRESVSRFIAEAGGIDVYLANA